MVLQMYVILPDFMLELILVMEMSTFILPKVYVIRKCNVKDSGISEFALFTI